MQLDFKGATKRLTLRFVGCNCKQTRTENCVLLKPGIGNLWSHGLPGTCGRMISFAFVISSFDS